MNSKEYLFSFEKLDVWKISRRFSYKVYMLSQEFPSNEKFALTDQIRRAAISISSNIAEGSSRFSRKDFARFIEISFVSLMEVLNQAYLALDLKYIDEVSFHSIKDDVHAISIKLSALRNALLKQLFD